MPQMSFLVVADTIETAIQRIGLSWSKAVFVNTLCLSLENTNYALKCLSIPVVGDDTAETVIPLTWPILSTAVFVNTLCLSLENTNYAPNVFPPV